MMMAIAQAEKDVQHAYQITNLIAIPGIKALALFHIAVLEGKNDFRRVKQAAHLLKDPFWRAEIFLRIADRIGSLKYILN